MKQCIFCSQPLTYNLSIRTLFSGHSLEGNLACQNCLDLFQPIDPKTACPGCSRQQTQADWCEDCLKWKKYVTTVQPKHLALFEYNEIAKEYMEAFKFQGDVYLAKLFKEEIADALKEYRKTHLITMIPSRESSYQQRGFNQVELLLKYAKIDYHSIINHSKETPLQSRQTRQERLRTVQPFEFIASTERKNLKKPVLIIDDVYTTGRTIFHARELLETVVPTVSMSLFR